MKAFDLDGTAGKSLLVFDIDDEFHHTMIAFVKDRDIRGGHFKAIGAFRKAVIAWWNWDTKEYENIDVDEAVEVVSLIGNVAMTEDGEPKIHAHVALGRRDGSLVGGHLVEGHVRPTLELVLEQASTEVTRRKDELTGLPLISIGL